MTIGIVSAGHMGSGLGWALRDGGARVVTTLDGRSERSARFARTAELDVLPSLQDVVAAADTVLLVTPPGAALQAARAVAAAAAATGCRPLVADLNAIAPSTVEAELAALGGLDLVDGSISGPPPTWRAGARLYFSGARATEVASLPWRHVQPIVLPGPAGRASALKMCTASVYKGMNGLLTQALRAAAHYGVLDQVLADLDVNGLGDTGGIASGAAKAHRYVAEMLEIAAAQHAAGITPALFSAFAEVYAEIARTELASGEPEHAPRALPAAELAARLAPPPISQPAER